MILSWLQPLLVLAGAALHVAALAPVQATLRQAPRHRLGWRFLQGLIIFFVFGYLAFGYFLLGSTGSSIETIVVMVFLAGAVFVLIVTRMSLRTVLQVKRIAERERYRTLHDALTGLPNRTLLRDRIVYTISMSKRASGAFAIMVMDLDHFKEVNDTLGHEFGDVLLRQVAKRLRSAVRESDTIARLGGDEFAALLPGTGSSDAVIVANKLTKLLEQPFDVNGHQLTVGVSIGICAYPLHGGDPETLLQRADIAMYNAKRKEMMNASCAIYDIDQDQHTLEKLTLMGELREAIHGGGLAIHYQPKIRIQDGSLCGVEALVRWPHPKLGMVPPMKFVPLAEQTGQIYALTRWVLNAVLGQYAAWRRDGMRVPVAVNISLKDLRDVEFAEHIRRLLAHWDVPAKDLTLEFTESCMMGDAERTIDVISRLHALGLKLAIDDFGSGYSSLAYLKRLPIPEIKIDRSFVMDMANDESDAVIVRSTIDLAHNMGLKVIAEGVESQDILDLLAILGCDAAQGYHFARPMPADQIVQWLRERRAA